jgi:hypothetical protein
VDTLLPHPGTGMRPLVPQGAAGSWLQWCCPRHDWNHYRETDGTKIRHSVLGEAWTRDAGRQSINQLPGLPNLPQAANSECVKWQPRS